MLENTRAHNPIRVVGVYNTRVIANENAAALACVGCICKHIDPTFGISSPEDEMPYVREDDEWVLGSEKIWVQLVG